MSLQVGTHADFAEDPLSTTAPSSLGEDTSSTTAPSSFILYSAETNKSSEAEVSQDTAGGPSQYNPKTSGPGFGFLIDLDGTMYRGPGLLPGAKDFYAFLKRQNIPHVFLSNTGSKTSIGTQNKFASKAYLIDTVKVPLSNIWTAADAQINMMTDDVHGLPRGARVFVVSGFKGAGHEHEWLNLLRDKNPDLVKTWDIRTSISKREAEQWGYDSAQQNSENPAYVVMFFDGPISPKDPFKSIKAGEFDGHWPRIGASACCKRLVPSLVLARVRR